MDIRDVTKTPDELLVQKKKKVGRKIRAPHHGKRKYEDGPKAHLAIWLGHSWLSDCIRFGPAETEALMDFYEAGGLPSLGEAIFMLDRGLIGSAETERICQVHMSNDADVLLRLSEDVKAADLKPQTKHFLRLMYFEEAVF